MRRPLWLPLRPPSTVREFEEFKLPRPPTLLEAHDETPAEKESRKRYVRQEAFRFYQTVQDHLSDDAAKALFKHFITEPRRRGGKEGSIDPARDRQLLAKYDELEKKLVSEADAATRLRLAAESIEEPMTTVDSRIKHLRRLLHRREMKRALQEARTRRLVGSTEATEDQSLFSRAVAIKPDA
jgi:hypothetical protein